MSAEIADVFDAAADYIETYGWVQGKWGQRYGDAACANGAIQLVIGESHAYFGVIQTQCRFGQFLIDTTGWFDRGSFEGFENGAVTAWNDTTGRTEQEVLDALRAAAKAER